ncbi:MAG: DNA-directed RNA polymerase subunit alpha [Patescibacteria group bacterium]|jgi:DNA-directed RNA polymerase subunit alpha
MKNISLPKKFIVEEITKGSKAKVVIEPCFPGYGLTLGNSLRRVLLSSLPGGAVTAVKIKGVQHEFSSLENVSDDILEIILNLKKLRIKVYGDEPVVLKLKAKGEKSITGGDIEPSADAEIINKDLVITTVNDKDTTLEMDLTVAKGIGYVPTEEQGKGKGEIGTILVDSIFTPVINVGMDVEATRVGNRTDFDKLILTVETDGTISPEDAVKKASEILVSQFNWIMEGGIAEVEEIDIEAPVISTLPEVEEVVTPEIESAVEEVTEEVEGDDKPKRRGRPKKA